MRKRFQKVVTRSAMAMVLGIALTAACQESWAAEVGKAPTKSAPAKRKAWKNAWAPKNTPLRGILADAVSNTGEW